MLTGFDREEWSAWSARYPASPVLHLDSAAAGRQSLAVLRATADHAVLEAMTGGYVAEQKAANLLLAGRNDLAGLLGVPAEGLAFVESASAGLQALLRMWPLHAGATVAVAPSEWGPNLQAFEDRGLRISWLPVDADGRIDLAALPQLLAESPPTVVHLVQVAAHRSLIQPVADAAALCRAAGVPLWVDAAQALGQVDTDTGAAAAYATGRKWLAGPRGVGVLAVAPAWWDVLRIAAPVLDPGVPVLHRLESADANVAGRVGLSVAVAVHLADVPSRIHQRLREVGRETGTVLGDLPNWQVLEAGEPRGAVTALRPSSGQDVSVVRARLLAEFDILTTASLPSRAPAEMTEPLLRISPQVGITGADLQRLRDALSQL